MKIYLDSSALNRIFDDQSQARIYLEATAMILVFELIEQDKVEVVSSEVLAFEQSRNPYAERRLFASAVLNRAITYQKIVPEVVQRAQVLVKERIKPLDALHLACAEAMAVDAVLTCDDRLLKTRAAKVKVISPPQFVLDLMKEEPEETDDGA